jgi:S1-C subfamily serine protease
MTFGLVTAFPTASPAATSPASVAAPTPTPNAVAAVSSQSTDLSAVVAQATKSVVTITSQTTVRQPFSFYSIPATGVGSGIIVSSNGLILTNNHVVEGSQKLTVTTADGQSLQATVVSTDPAHDLAVIKASGGSHLVAATLGDSSKLEVGQTVLAIGSPLGEFTETVTKGIVSALDRSITVTDDLTGRQVQLSGLVQTDAAINPGNSGGPLINESGQVMGMNSALASNSEGIGFAIPINAAKDMISQAAQSAA